MLKRGGLIYDSVVFVVVFVLCSVALNWVLPGTTETPAVRILPGLVGGYLGFTISRLNRKRRSEAPASKSP